MAQKRLLKKFDIDTEVLDSAVNEAMESTSEDSLSQLYEDSIKNFTPDSIIEGRVVKVLNNEVLVYAACILCSVAGADADWLAGHAPPHRGL